jgi:glycine hydroxymethyltransferase
MILCQEEFKKAIDKTVFPGMQGGPLMHVVAAKAVALKEALQPSFKDYANNVVANAKTLAATLQDAGLRIVSGGTDTHLMLVDLRSVGIDGKTAEHALDSVGITTNRNAIPYDPQPPAVTSGLRLGSAAVTTRGFTTVDMQELGRIIAAVLHAPHDEHVLAMASNEVAALTPRFPVPGITVSR